MIIPKSHSFFGTPIKDDPQFDERFVNKGNHEDKIDTLLRSIFVQSKDAATALRPDL